MFLTRCVVIVVFLVSTSACCEKVTFVNVSVTVLGVRGIDTISGCLEPVGPMEKVSYIQVINQTVPILYKGAVKDLHNLADLILDSSNVLQIEPGAFQNLSNLRLLRFKHNGIQRIQQGVFNNLPVNELNLMNNNISVIEEGAFDNMTKLTIVNLDNNQIIHWNKYWFKNCPEINTLSFQNNLLLRIPSRAFQNIKGLHFVNGRNVTTNIFLTNNKIEFIDPSALEGLETVGWLFLGRNQLREIPENLLDPVEQIDWLKLNFNLLTCVPDKVLRKIKTVVNYLEGNPLNETCKNIIDTL